MVVKLACRSRLLCMTKVRFVVLATTSPVQLRNRLLAAGVAVSV